MTRKEELVNSIKELDDARKSIVLPLIDDVVFMEEQLNKLKKLPFIKIHPTNPDLQKSTPAAKQYKEILQQYNNCIKILVGTLSKNEEVGDSPLKAYFKRFTNQ